MIMVLVLFPDEWVREIWKGETRGIIFLALIATFMQGTVWPIASQMGEASRKTFEVQRLNTVIVLIHFISIFVLWFFGQLTLPSIFFLILIEWSFGALIGYRLYEFNTEKQLRRVESNDTSIVVFKEFYEYCLPFIPYALFSFAHDFGDRWMLQNWGGSSEQAFYTISYQFATISLIGTTSILKIFWKEIAEAHQNGNHERVRILFMKITRGLYFLGAVSAGALIPWTAEIIYMMLGEQYTGAYFTMILMFIYPVHQSIGQIGSTLLLATSKTKVQVKLGIAFMALSIILVYYFLAPSDLSIPGLGLASNGLAWKMVIMQFIQVNILIFIISRLFKWHYDWKYQVYGLLPVSVIGWLLKLGIVSFSTSSYVFINMGIFVFFYLLFVGFFVYLFPAVSGLKREEIDFRQWKRVFK